jgi:nucleotide-binding universal stress UspA family protein
MTSYPANRTSGSSRGDDPVAEIVVGMDGSPAATAALLWAGEQSAATGLPLRVVYAWHMKALEMSSATPEFCEAATADARARATRWVLDALGGDAAEIRWTLDIVEGPPGPVLVARSRGARLLVLGTRGHTGLRRAVLGSVSHYCLSHADPPVVAVPELGAAAVPA